MFRQLSCENSNQSIFLYFNTQNYWKPWQPIRHHHSCALNNKWRDNMTRVGVIGMINSGLSIPGPPTRPHYRENYVSLARLLYRQSNAMHSVRSSFVLDISLYQIRFFQFNKLTAHCSLLSPFLQITCRILLPRSWSPFLIFCTNWPGFQTYVMISYFSPESERSELPTVSLNCLALEAWLKYFLPTQRETFLSRSNSPVCPKFEELLSS